MRWIFAALIVGILAFLMGLAIPYLAGGSPTELGGPPELFGIRLGGLELFLFAGGLILLTMALAGAVHEIRSNPRTPGYRFCCSCGFDYDSAPAAPAPASPVQSATPSTAQPAPGSRTRPGVVTAGAVCWLIVGAINLLGLIVSILAALDLDISAISVDSGQMKRIQTLIDSLSPTILSLAISVLFVVLPFAVGGYLLSNPSRGTVIRSGVLAGLWAVLGLILMLSVNVDDLFDGAIAVQAAVGVLGGILPFLAWSQVSESRA